MVCDYERAWVRLQELIASKPQHGREGTLQAMAEIQADCQVPAGELSRLLRLYGVEVERVRAAAAETDRDELVDFAGGASSPADRDSPSIIDRGGHDVTRDAGTRAVAVG